MYTNVHITILSNNNNNICMFLEVSKTFEARNPRRKKLETRKKKGKKKEKRERLRVGCDRLSHPLSYFFLSLINQEMIRMIRGWNTH